MNADQTENPRSDADRSSDTGLPLLRTWPAVYAFVLAAFIVSVILLWLFTFSLTRASS